MQREIPADALQGEQIAWRADLHDIALRDLRVGATRPAAPFGLEQNAKPIDMSPTIAPAERILPAAFMTRPITPSASYHRSTI
jgi:hypothetical protein